MLVFTYFVGFVDTSITIMQLLFQDVVFKIQ